MRFYRLFLPALILAAVTLVGCNPATSNSPAGAVTATGPTVLSVVPLTGAISVGLYAPLSATFSGDMDQSTLIAANFTLQQGSTAVAGTVTKTATKITFTPSVGLTINKLYTATVTTGVKDVAGNAMTSANVWTFTTVTTAPHGPATVNLDNSVAQGTYGGAGQYVILAKTLISSAGGELVTGDIAISPAAATFIQGFSLTLDASTTFSTSSQLTGVSRAYAADYTSPTPANLTEAVTNMITAYNDAAGRPTPDATELGAGDISGMTLVPGLYKWGTGVNINTDLTLTGSATDIWIFQIAGTLALANGINITLTGGALPQNVFWQTAGTAGVTIGTTAHFQGIVLASKQISVNTSAVVHGRLLSQTAVTLAANTTVGP